jgi:pimeloyl-ACP methyl ester carboxylesterase
MVAWRVPGASPALVCVHGAGVSSRELLAFLREMAGTRETWAVDLPGFGASTSTAGVLGLSDLVTAVRAWLHAAGLDRAVLVGCSFGCQVVTEVALRAPEQVVGLVLMGPTTDPTAASWSAQIVRWVRNSVHEPPQLGPLIMRDYFDAGSRRVLGTFSTTLHDRLDERLSHIDVPTLVIRGARDAIVPQAWAEEVTRLLPHGRLITHTGSGHMVPFSDPAGFAALVEPFASSEVA